MFYDKLFSSLDFTLPKAATGRRGFPKEAMVCAFIVMKCEGFTQITDLMDYLDTTTASSPITAALTSWSRCRPTGRMTVSCGSWITLG
ncbi:MAG: hypothetical protein SOY89_05130 [Dysosmobacter sp.]|nr:hypothetical protein [Dysosmobacter sp.]